MDQPFENYHGHIAHLLMGVALAQPFLDLPSLTTRLCLLIVLTFSTFFYAFQFILQQTFPPGDFDIDTALMIYGMLLRILPQTVLSASAVGILLCFVFVFLQQPEMVWMIGR